jgi:flagellar basal body-associated protein FliL
LSLRLGEKPEGIGTCPQTRSYTQYGLLRKLPMKIIYIIIMSCLALAIFFGFALFMSKKAKEWEEQEAELAPIHKVMLKLADIILQYWYGVVGVVVVACAIALVSGKGKKKQEK